MRPTRGFTCIGPGQPYPPIWPCSTRGFPCLRCRHRSGGLLPHRFTLTGASPELACARFCLRRPPSAFHTGGFVSVALSVAESSRIQPPGVTRRVALSVFENGGVRTFLQRAPCGQRASDHPIRPLFSLYLIPAPDCLLLATSGGRNISANGPGTLLLYRSGRARRGHSVAAKARK